MAEPPDPVPPPSGLAADDAERFAANFRPSWETWETEEAAAAPSPAAPSVGLGPAADVDGSPAQTLSGVAPSPATEASRPPAPARAPVPQPVEMKGGMSNGECAASASAPPSAPPKARDVVIKAEPAVVVADIDAPPKRPTPKKTQKLAAPTPSKPAPIAFDDEELPVRATGGSKKKVVLIALGVAGSIGLAAVVKAAVSSRDTSVEPASTTPAPTATATATADTTPATTPPPPPADTTPPKAAAPNIDDTPKKVAVGDATPPPAPKAPAPPPKTDDAPKPAKKGTKAGGSGIVRDVPF